MLLLQFININKPPAKISGGTISLGQDRSNDIVIDEPGVSDFHAEISIDGNRITLSDLLSENGTYVNGNRISRNKELQPWDRIQLAAIEIEISEPEKYRPGDWALKKESNLLNSQYIPLQAITTIGRSPDCDLVILDGLLSRKHAVLTIEGNQLRVEDLHSANGTYINQVRVETAHASPGDEITFDKISFELLGPSSDYSSIEPEDSTIFREEQEGDATLLQPTGNSTVSPIAHNNDATLADEQTSLIDSEDPDSTVLFQPEKMPSDEKTILIKPEASFEKTVLSTSLENVGEDPKPPSPLKWASIGFSLSILTGLLLYLFLR